MPTHAGPARTPTFALALITALGSIILAPDANARPRHRHSHGGVRVYPSFSLAIVPGAAPAAGVGFLGLGLGVGTPHVPFSVGVALPVAVPGAPADPRGSVRLQVPERETEVFVDGYYAGVVDDFDGSFQRLRLDPGPHTVTLYLDGYRPYEETVNSTLGSTIKIRHEMEPLEPDEPIPMRPSVGAAAPAAYGAPAPAPAAPAPGAAVSASVPSPPVEYGALSVRSQPGDAEVWIDGELWEPSPDSDHVRVYLPVGPHDLRLSKDGYADFELGIEIQPGETESLNVRMTASP